MSTRSIMMRCCVSLALIVAMTATAQADTTWQRKGSGRSAEVQFSDAGGGGRLNLVQIKGSSFMFYESWGNDPTSILCNDITDQFGNIVTVCTFRRTAYDSGWGEIPNTDVQFTGADAHLLTTTGASFFSTHCVTDSAGPAPVTSCAPAVPASFDLTWTASNTSGTQSLGASRQTIGVFRFDSVARTIGTSAYVKGSALGHPLEKAPGATSTVDGAVSARY